MTWQTIDRNPSVLEQYPRTLRLAEGSVLTVAPVAVSDQEPLAEYLGSVPDEEQLFLWEDVSVIVENWVTHSESPHTLSLLVRDGSQRIVADGALYHESGVWTTHSAKLRVFVRPDFRGRGIGAEIVRELIDVARLFRLHRLVADCTAEQTELLALLLRLDFVEAGRLRDFVHDRHGRLHEMVVMVNQLG